MFEQRRLDGTKLEMSHRVEDAMRKMAKLKEAADSIRVSVSKHPHLHLLFTKSLLVNTQSIELKSEKIGFSKYIYDCFF